MSRQEQIIVKSHSLTAHKYVIRFPDGMKERIRNIAAISHRSMNAEIITRLEQSIRDDPTVDHVPAVLVRTVDVDGWIPTEGQFVYKTSTDGKSTKTYGTLKSIYLNGHGEIEATVINNWVGNFIILLKDLKPVVVK